MLLTGKSKSDDDLVERLSASKPTRAQSIATGPHLGPRGGLAVSAACKVLFLWKFCSCSLHILFIFPANFVYVPLKFCSSSLEFFSRSLEILFLFPENFDLQAEACWPDKPVAGMPLVKEKTLGGGVGEGGYFKGKAVPSERNERSVG